MIDRRLKLEALERRLLLAADFGDAPEPYDTLLADNGARHEAVGPMLGATRDSEADGHPTLNSDGDGADDDGVTFGTIRVGQLDASVIVNVQNAPLGAKLDAWIDFNGDGSWGGAGERIAASISMAEGENVIEFDVPANIALGETYARFRVSSAGSLNVTGPAADGEVEDYRIEISSARGTLGFVPEEHLIDVPTVSRSYHVVDLDNDGDQDLISSGTRIRWLENDGTGNITEHMIADSIYGDYLSTAGDIDLDGDIDIVSVSTIGTMYWFESDGSQGFTQHRITTGQGVPKTINLADWDCDGDVDIISAGPSRGFVAYVNDGNETFTEQIVVPTQSGPSVHGIYSIHPIDMDRDGDLDVVVAGHDGNRGISWYQNDGTQQFVEQPDYSVGSPSTDTSAVWPTDFDGDGDIDIAYTVSRFNGNVVGWLENNGAQAFIPRTISYDVAYPTAISVTDINGDGEMDVVAFSDTMNTIDLFLSDQTHNFTKASIADATQGYNLTTPIVADFDGDGDLDVVTSDSQRKIIWYEAYPTSHYVVASLTDLIEDSSTTSTITFTRTGDVSAEETFNFTVLGSASFGTDYTVAGTTTFDATTGSITFSAGASTATLTITPVADGDFEGDETVIIRVADYSDIGLLAQPTNPTDAVVTILHDEPADFGDAADTYLTTTAKNGPSHGIIGPRLGATRDSEADGQSTPNADGDGADDDGVTFGTLRVGQQDAAVTVNVQNAPTGARLDAWFDFDGDGNFFGPDEQVAVSVLLAEGDNAVSIDIPATARSGETTARFRLSTAGGLSYVGYSVEGEVEDYRVTISPPAAAAGVFAARPPISTSAVSARDVVTADLDGDGDVDLVYVGNDLITWHENVGNGQFVSHNTTASASGEIKVVDLDRDGDLDFIAVLGHGIVWYENDGSENFVPHQLTGYLPSAADVFAADMDSDGDLDLVALGGNVYSNGSLVWFENLGDESFSAMTTIAETEHTDAIALGDVNGDGHVDIVASVNTSPFIRLTIFVNDGDANFLGVAVDSPVAAITSIEITDLDSDGDGDIVAVLGPTVVWFENNGMGDFSTWTLIESPERISDVRVADVDGDGTMDLIAISYVNNRAYWYKNDGAPDPTFNYFEIGTTSRGPWSSAVGDLDGDGDLDVVTAARTDNRISWFESIPANSGDFDLDGDVDGRDFLAWQRGTSPKPLASNDLADWQATYSYPTPEVPTTLSDDAISPDATGAAVAAVDEVLAESEDTLTARSVVLPPVPTAQVSRPNKVPSRSVTHLHHDRVFAELGTPSRTFVRDFGDIVTRRDVAKRPLLALSDVDE